MNVQLHRIDSHSELLEKLRGKSHLLLGERDECHREYFVVHTASCDIGICSQGHGLKPSGLIDESGGAAWVGYNSEVANVNLNASSINFVVKLAWVFYEFLEQMSDGSVIAIHELGAVRIDRKGKVLWNRPTDVVVEFWSEGNSVCLRTDEGDIRIDKDSGE